jgi:hypothetical protein
MCGNPLSDIFPNDTFAVCRWNGSSFDIFSIAESKLWSFGVIDIDPGVGFTWGTADVFSNANNDTLKFVAGANITIETDPAMNAIRISSTGGAGGSNLIQNLI